MARRTKNKTGSDPRIGRVGWLPLWTGFCFLLFCGFVAAYARYERQRLPVLDTVMPTSFVDPSLEDLSEQERLELALKALDAGQVSEAERQLIALRSQTAKDPTIRYLEGMILLRRGMLEESLKRFSSLVNDPQFRARSLAAIGEILMKSGRYRDAEAALQQSVQLDSTLVDSHRWLGILYNDLGAMELAIQHLKQVGTLAPDDPRPYRLMGRINKDYERYPLAIDDYKESLRRDPLQQDREAVLMELATSHVHVRQYDEAMEILKTLPETSDTLALMAESLRSLGQEKEAVAKLERSLELNPKHLASLLRSAEIAVSHNQFDEAIEFLEQAMAAFPNDDAAKYQMGLVLRRQGKEEEAEKLIKASQELRDRRHKLYEMHLEAIQNPYDAELRFKMAKGFLEFGLPDTAKQWLRATLALSPSHQEARKLYSELETGEK